MVNVETSIIINRPIEEVFAFVTDIRNSSLWDSGLVDIQQTPQSPLGMGTRITEVRKFLGRKMETNSEVVEYEPPTKYTRKGTGGPFPITGSLTFEPTAEGTKLTWIFKMQPGGFFALAEPLIARSLKKALESGLGTAKGLLENQVVGISS